MTENKKNLIIGGVIVLGLVVAIIILFSMIKDKAVVVPEVAPETNGEVSEVVPPKTVVPVKNPVVKDSYSKALAEYSQNGRRIQFNESCQATPFLSTFANGTTIMLDNRSSQDRTIRIGTKTYNVSAYSYDLAKLSVATSPTTYYVDCDSQQNPATIIVQ